jgi:hypothetical protein
MAQTSAPENALPPSRRRVERVRRTARRPVGDTAWTRILLLRPNQLLVLFLIALVLPIGLTVAGLQLSPYSIMLLVFVVPAFLYWLQHAPRVVMLDAFMLCYILWMGVAIYHNHGMSRAVFIVNQTVTLLGAYMLGRILVRDAASYRLMFTTFFWILLALLPFALVELLLQRSIPAMVFGLPGASGGGLGGIRLGMRRVASVFPHPILFGIFCSMMVSNFFYVFHERTRTRLSRTLLAIAMTFMSLSTGPNLSQLGQLILIGWERLFRIFVTKWVVLAVATPTMLAVFQLTYPGGITAFVIDHLAFNQQTGSGRLEIIEYGSQTVAQHPVFGIGLNPWNGPWWRPVSVDNFWMVTAIRYGLPALGLFWAGLLWHAARIVGRGGLTEEAASYRKGYVFALAGTVFALGAVHVWGSVAILFLFYIGAGAWFYEGRAALAPAGRPGRTAGRPGRGDPLPSPTAPPAGRRGADLPSRRINARQDMRR